MAIIHASEPQPSDQTFVMIIYGAPGVGKTTLALSAPDPLLIDFDDGMHRVSARHRKDYIRVGKYEDVLADLKSPEIAGYKTIVIDTGGSFVTYLKDWALRTQKGARTQAGEFNSHKGFGYVKTEFSRLASYIKDTLHKNLIFIFHSTEGADKDGNPIQRLMCEGAARNTVWNSADFGGYLQMMGGKRCICFTPADEYFAKGCHGVSGINEVKTLGPADPNAFVTRLFETARANIDEENTYFLDEKAAYASVIGQIRLIIDEVTDAETATQAAGELKELEHALTSQAEARKMLSDKTKELKLKWSAEEKKYVSEE